MRNLFLFITLLGAGCMASARKQNDPVSLLENLSTLRDYSGEVTYSVLLPQAEEPVVYKVSQLSTATDDPLSPADYLIEWSLNGSEGFSAYFDGNHYRYRDNRLQEYHYTWDSIPLLMGHGGVQQQAQFVDILPQFIGREVGKLLTDTTFVYTFTPDSTYNGSRADILKGKLIYHGYTSKEMVYVFDPETGLPVAIEFENNPGAISEQSVSIKFANIEQKPFPVTSEEYLTELYPEVFERFRESSFKVENLPGTLLPPFSAPTSDGERCTHHRGDTFVNPTIFIVVNDAIESTGATIEAVRNAVDRSATNVDVIIGFTTNNAERAENATGPLRPGERMLLGARGLARDCGISLFPTLIYVGRDGRVADVTLGYNKELPAIVIQKVALM